MDLGGSVSLECRMILEEDGEEEEEEEEEGGEDEKEEEEEEEEAGMVWRREGYKFSNGNHTFVGQAYRIPNASREDAGFYYCTGESREGK